jgi:hypothetical protein
MGKQNEPDGDPDIGDGVKRVAESRTQGRKPGEDTDARDGLTALTHSDTEQQDE